MPSFGALGVGQTQQSHNQCHADVDAVLHLLKVGGAGVIVHVEGDLVDAGAGDGGTAMSGLARAIFSPGEDVAVFQPDVVLLVEEPLPLDAGHIENIQTWHRFLQAAGLGIGNVAALQHVGDDVVGHPEFLGADEDKPHSLIADHGLDEGVDGAAELQVAAQADGQTVQGALAAADGHQVGEGLGGVLVAAVAGVDDRDAGVAAGPQGSALLGMAHGHDVGIAGHHPDGVGHALTLGRAGNILTGEAQDMAAQVEHGGFEGQAGAGGGLIEQGGQFLVPGHVPVSGGVLPDAAGQVEQGVGLFAGEIKRINQMTHGQFASL